jgi:hypothetical protein
MGIEADLKNLGMNHDFVDSSMKFVENFKDPQGIQLAGRNYKKSVGGFFKAIFVKFVNLLSSQKDFLKDIAKRVNEPAPFGINLKPEDLHWFSDKTIVQLKNEKILELNKPLVERAVSAAHTPLTQAALAYLLEPETRPPIYVNIEAAEQAFDAIQPKIAQDRDSGELFKQQLEAVAAIKAMINQVPLSKAPDLFKKLTVLDLVSFQVPQEYRQALASCIVDKMMQQSPKARHDNLEKIRDETLKQEVDASLQEKEIEKLKEKLQKCGTSGIKGKHELIQFKLDELPSYRTQRLETYEKFLAAISSDDKNKLNLQ